MKKLVLITILLISAVFTVYSQKDFIKEDKTDDMTGKRLMYTKKFIVKMPLTGTYYGRFTLQNDVTFFEFTIATNSVKLIPKDAKLILKLENDSLITLYNHDMVMSTRSKPLFPIYILTKEQLDIFSKSILTKIRIYYSDKYDDIDINYEGGSRFMEYAAAFLNKI